MAMVYLNDNLVDQEKAMISPMDRGFLFGDGIYEVIPCYDGKPVGLDLHLARMNRGLNEIQLKYKAERSEWMDKINHLISQYDKSSVGVYIHVSRGTDTKRFHAYPQDIQPTVFAYAFEIPPSQSLDCSHAKTFTVATVEDLRWQRCHIKSTSLLGNVMHFQQGQNAGTDEVILYNQDKIVTEAAACNVFIVKNNLIMTPKLDNHILPGITREILLHALREEGFHVSEQDISLESVNTADEIWLTSSSKELGPVSKIDERVLNNGKAGPMWLLALQAYNKYKFAL
ncbi:aminotransferase class IV [Glaciecola petra]|uniref:Aminotransferase class IV n=1 Tax=Glaciecola petra TaxID=3075602 RepID=A0ABU2ZP39_9ALTE|nr:aminotransferase class IV [Aestuariibacter sp. P117]MDT0594389.1 aminotransferase class IV [Aestuariibacter sp. P117]